MTTPPATQQMQQDIEDAKLFRVWIEEASHRPGRLAQAICHCVTPDQYREILRGFAIATRIENDLSCATHVTEEAP
jgi:hypothetical protein